MQTTDETTIEDRLTKIAGEIETTEPGAAALMIEAASSIRFLRCTLNMPVETTLIPQFRLLREFIDAEAELRGEEDRGYPHTTEQAVAAVEYLEEAIAGAYRIAIIAGKEITDRDRRVRELLAASTRINEQYRALRGSVDASKLSM